MHDISVIVPVYNSEKYLKSCLDSIINQTYKNLEIILVDDGSTDHSGQICDEYAGKDSRIRVFHQKNSGVVMARKKGLIEASGEYINFVDSDDWIEPDMYRELVDKAEMYECDIVMCDIIFPKGMTANVIDQTMDEGLYDKKRLEEKIYPTMLYNKKFYNFGITPSLCDKIIRREIISKYLIPLDNNISMGEDVSITYSCFLEAEKYYYIKKKMYHYRQNDSQMTRSYDPKCFEKTYALCNYLQKTEIAKSPYKEQLTFYYAWSIRIIISNEMSALNKLPFRAKIRNMKKCRQFPFYQQILSEININEFPIRHRIFFTLYKHNMIILSYFYEKSILLIKKIKKVV